MFSTEALIDLNSQDKQYHTALKRSIASAYSVSTVMGYEKAVEDTVDYLLQRLDELFISTGVTCPLDKWLQWCWFELHHECVAMLY